jgi:hypothetical protein
MKHILKYTKYKGYSNLGLNSRSYILNDCYSFIELHTFIRNKRYEIYSDHYNLDVGSVYEYRLKRGYLTLTTKNTKRYIIYAKQDKLNIILQSDNDIYI